MPGLLALGLLLAGAAALADNADEDPVAPDEELTLDEVEAVVSEQVRLTAAQLDAFFGDSRYVDERNDTELWLGLGLGVEDRRGIDVPTRARARLRLPLAERRLALVLGRGVDPQLPSRRIAQRLDEDRERRDASLGLRLALRQEEAESLSATAGIRVSSGTPQVYLGPRYRRSWLRGDWGLTSTLELRWLSRDGFAAGADLDFERETGRRTFLRLTPSLDWEEVEPGLGYGLAARLFHRVGRQRVLSYFATSRFRSARPRGLDVASLGIRYRQTWLRDWIFLELTPAIMFRDEFDHKPTARITARVDFVFGGPRGGGGG